MQSLANQTPHVYATLFTGVVALCLAVGTLYPGWYSFDSAYVLHQARTGTYSNLQPPLMAVLWNRLLEIGAPPGSLLVIHLAVYVAGSVMLGLAVRSIFGVLFPLVLLWPPFLAVFGHVWIDVSLAASLVFAAGWIAWTRSIGRVHWSWLAAVALTYAVCARHNAVLAIPPFYYLLVCQTPALPTRTLARIALAALLTLGSFAVSMAVTRIAVEKPVPVWAPTAIWDLSAASVASGELLLPAGVRGSAMSVDELRPAVNPHEMLDLLMGTKSGINTGIVEPLPDSVKRELLVRWLSLPFTDTQAWLQHRWGVARSLLGRQPASKQQHLFIQPGVASFGDNPPIHQNTTAANAILVETALGLRPTWWCAPIAYLLLSIAAVWLTLTRATAGDRAVVWCLAASAWGFALPLMVLVPSTDWRYSLWATVSSVLALLFALVGSRPRNRIVAAAQPDRPAVLT